MVIPRQADNSTQLPHGRLQVHLVDVVCTFESKSYVTFSIPLCLLKFSITREAVTLFSRMILATLD